MRSKRVRRPLGVAVAVILIASGCGGNGDGSTATEPTSTDDGAAASTDALDETPTTDAPVETPTTDAAAEPAAIPGGGGTGWLEVDGNREDLALVFRCDPTLGPATEGFRAVGFVSDDGDGYGLDLDALTGFGYDLGFSLMVDVSREQYSGFAGNDGPGGTNWEPEGFTFIESGNRIAGGPITLTQDYPDETDATHVVSFDITMPSEIQEDC